MEAFRGHMHPLQSQDILEHLFQKLRLNDLMTCRLVCKTWRDSCAVAMRSCVIVQIRNDEEDVEENVTINGKGIVNFLELVKNEKCTFLQSPFTHTFVIKNGIMDYPEFWKLCGNSIKSLVLERVAFQSVQAVRNALFYSCPNLEELKLRCVKVKGCHSSLRSAAYVWVEPESQNRNLKSLKYRSLFETDLGLSWIEILSHFPSLQDLNIKNLGYGCEPVFRLLAVVRNHDAESWNLKKLAFKFEMMEASEEVEPALMDEKLALEGLTIERIGLKEDARTVQRILSAHATSLKKLSLDFALIYDFDLFPLLDNVTLGKLEELYLGSEDGKLKSMIFLAAVPNLKRLHLSFSGIPRELDCDYLKVESCTEFILDSELNTEIVQMMTRLLPNVKKLEIENLDNETFAKVCECWPNLVSLRMPNCQVDDSGISGLDEDDVKRINGVGVEGFRRPITVPRANLTSLKCLRKLSWSRADTIDQFGYCSRIYGTDQLPNLLSEAQVTGR